jgi:hypothetical protein
MKVIPFFIIFVKKEIMGTENLFIVGYGLAGGFGGIQNYVVIEASSESDAEDQARLMSVEEYESYAGSNGLRDIQDIMDEDEVDEDEAYEIYDQEMDSWLDYEAEPFTKERLDELNEEGYNVENRFTEITDKL